MHGPSRRLLVIGAGSWRSAAFPRWREMGIAVVLVDGVSATRYDHLASEFYALDPRDGHADLEAIRDIARRCDGVTTLSDSSQVTAAAIAEDLGLPGVGRAAACVARSKLLQRAVCEEAGMRVPRWRRVLDERDLREFYADGARPAILKPADSAGSTGVLRVESLDEAVRQWRAVRLLSPARSVIIEDFLSGREVCVDAVVVDGRPLFVSVCEGEYRRFIAVAARYAAQQPERDVASAAITQLVSALKVARGTVHAEFKIEDGRWSLLEAALRPGGALVPELTARVTRVDLYELQARLALGETPSVPPYPSATCDAYAEVRFLVGDGQVRRSIAPAVVVAGLPDVKIVNQLAGPGRRVRVPLSEEGRAGYAAGWGPDRARLDEQLGIAIARLAREMGIALAEQVTDEVGAAA